MQRVLLVLGPGALLALVTTLAGAANPLYEALIQTGVTVSAKETLKLPTPALADGLSAAEQRQAIETAIDKRYPWEEFTRNAVVAPFFLKIADEQEGTLGRRVDAYFVAYGNLKKLDAGDPLTATLATGGGTEKSDESDWSQALSTAELTKRGLTGTDEGGGTRYVAAEMSLFEKVRLATFTQSLKTSSTDSLTIASILAQDKLGEYPNQWRAIQRDDAGRRQFGAPQTYAGMGGYLKVTKLVEPAGALFLECHLVFAEPVGWFNGANLLRSKLPIKFQDTVRKARRNIAKQSAVE